MRKALYTVLLLCGVCCAASAQDVIPMLRINKETVNIGIKAGFNSSLNYTDHIHIGDDRIKDLTHNFKVGYTTILFARFNLKRHHYIQPELSYSITKGSLSISNTMENKGMIEEDALIKSVIHSLDLPLFYGYKFIDSQPYGMSFFVGPKVSWFINSKSKMEYEGFYQKDIREKLNPINFSGVMGLGVNVSNIYFDFRYEVGINNISDYVVYDKEKTEEPYNKYDLRVHRRRNVISFAVGAIF